MDDYTFIALNYADICIANGNLDRVKSILRGIPTYILYGTIFERQNDPHKKESINLILNELRKRKGIKGISKEDTNTKVEEGHKHRLKERDLNDIFISLRRNIELFERKFDNKVFRVNTNNGRSHLLAINACNMFHLLGFNLQKWQYYHKAEMLRLFPELSKVLSSDYISVCIKEDRILFDALITILNGKDRIIDEILSGNIAVINAINMRKVKAKNFLFEKADFTASPSRVIKYSKETSNIKGDLHLAKDFINQNEREWVYFCFRNVTSSRYKTAESLLFNYIRKEEIKSFNSVYTQSIETYDKRDPFEPASVIRFDGHEIDYLQTKIYQLNSRVKMKKHT